MPFSAAITLAKGLTKTRSEAEDADALVATGANAVATGADAVATGFDTSATGVSAAAGDGAEEMLERENEANLPTSSLFSAKTQIGWKEWALIGEWM